MGIQIKVNTDKLLDHLTQVCSIVEKRVDFPSLGFLLFRFSGQDLQMTSSNMSMELSTTLQLEDAVKKDFSILVPAHKLFNLCRNMQCESVKLDFKDKILNLSSPQGNFKMATLSEEQFPLLDFEEKGEGFELKASVLIQSIRYTRSFIAPESSRAVLQGVNYELAGKNLVAVATDGHRMSCFQSPVDTEVEAQFILPRRSVNELVNHVKSSDETVRIEHQDGYVRFLSGDFRLTTRLVEGNYPDFRTVIPSDDTSNRVTIKCEDLSHTLKTIKVLINESTQSVLCEFEKDKLIVKTHNNETDEGECSLKLDYSGSPLSIVFNINYLFDVLTSIGSEHIEIFLQDSNKSCLLKKTEKEQSFVNEVRFVVMPMRI